MITWGHGDDTSDLCLDDGGTMEKVHSERTGDVGNVESKLDRYLALLRPPDCEVNLVALINKDSREMTDEDRVLVLGMVRAILKEDLRLLSRTERTRIVQTGPHLQRALPQLETPIVLTGAMTPLGFQGGRRAAESNREPDCRTAFAGRCLCGDAWYLVSGGQRSQRSRSRTLRLGRHPSDLASE
jgi:hypothetical protein